ncbi:MAG: SDR family NAD(P)-dependent oxidoreductase [Myxococcota bacterium]
MDKANKTALVTGSNSGIGFEAAALLAEDGWGNVILACRSLEKAEGARARLIERVGKDVFGLLAIDTSEVASAHEAADVLLERGEKLDFLLLNAGATKRYKVLNSGGVELSYASVLIGHHVLALRAIADGVLNPTARIVISSTEAIRGNIPGMSMHDVSETAQSYYNGDWAAAIEGLMRLHTPLQQTYSSTVETGTSKLLAAWWAGGLAQRLPKGMVVTAVSPGNVPATNITRDANLITRMMSATMRTIGIPLGIASSVEDGARRYLDGAEFESQASGMFYATADTKKLVGPADFQHWPEKLLDSHGHRATYDALVRLTGVGLREEAGLAG